MKRLILLIGFLLPTIFYSQVFNELNASSAGNVYYATNKNVYVTEYLTEPTNRYLLFVKTKVNDLETDYSYIYFQNKNELVGLLNTILRSIDKQKDITYKISNNQFTIVSITKNLSKIRYGNIVFSMDRQTTNEIINQFLK